MQGVLDRFPLSHYEDLLEEEILKVSEFNNKKRLYNEISRNGLNSYKVMAQWK